MPCSLRTFSTIAMGVDVAALAIIETVSPFGKRHFRHFWTCVFAKCETVVALACLSSQTGKLSSCLDVCVHHIRSCRRFWMAKRKSVIGFGLWAHVVSHCLGSTLAEYDDAVCQFVHMGAVVPGVAAEPRRPAERLLNHLKPKKTAAGFYT